MCAILIVDDDASIRFAMADYFVAKGLRAESVGSRAEVETRLATGHYAIVITDLRLTPLDEAEGLEVVRLVATRHAGTACIVLTAYGSPASEAAARRCGAGAFLHKPRAMADVLAIVQALRPPDRRCPDSHVTDVFQPRDSALSATAQTDPSVPAESRTSTQGDPR